MSLKEFPWLGSTTWRVSLRKGVNKDNISTGGQMGHGKRRDQETQGLLIVHGRGRMAHGLCSFPIWYTEPPIKQRGAVQAWVQGSPRDPTCRMA